jgi:hypothetical protein
LAKVRANTDLEIDIKAYADDKEVHKSLEVSSRNDFINKAIKQYDPHRKEVSPQFAAWMERKG